MSHHPIYAGLNGRTVRQLYQIVDAALGGGFVPFSIVDLSGVTEAVSTSFEGGFVKDYAQLHFELPTATAPVPEPSTWLLLLVVLGGFGIRVPQPSETAPQGNSG